MKKLTNVLVFASLFLTACSSTDEKQVFEQSFGESTISKIRVTTSDYVFDDAGGTRALTYDGSATSFAWALNDTIGIFPDEGDQMSFSMAAGVGTKDATVDGGGWQLKTTATYTAYSPFNRWNFFRDRQHILLDYTGQVEDGIADTRHLGAYDFQAANATSAVNGYLNFNMRRLNCILILKLTIPQAGTYTAIKLTADEDEFTTQANLSLDDEYSLTSIKKTKTLTLGLKNVTTTQDNQVAEFFLMLYPTNLIGKTYSVSLIGANGYVYKGTKTPTKSYNSGSATRTAITLTLDTSSTIGLGGEFSSDESDM